MKGTSDPLPRRKTCNGHTGEFTVHSSGNKGVPVGRNQGIQV